MIDIGFALTPGPLKGQIEAWMGDLDKVLPHLQGKVRSLWMPDHFFWEDMPTYEAMTVLTYLAARWPAFDVGSSVLGQTYRNPAMVAKMAATLHTLSGGRFILGMGAGWKEDEHRGYNYTYLSPKLRLQQLEDTLKIIRLLWEEPGPVSYQGAHYQIQDAYCEPRPDPAPIIMVGGGGYTTMRHAARYADWWNLSDVNIEQFTARLEILRQHCDTYERDFATIRKTWFGRLVLGKTEAEARQRGQTQGRSHYAGWTLEGALVGTPSQVIEQMQPFIDVGVDYLMLEMLDIEQPDVLEMVVNDVLPNIGK